MYILLFYFLMEIDSVFCQCDNNCKNCTLFTCSLCIDNFAPINEKCHPCFDGYYSNGLNCRQCQFGCSKCSSRMSCTKCFDQYQLNNNGNCTKQLCDKKNCINCDGLGSCQNCIEGYQLISGTCALCDENCKNCTINGCEECNQNYVLQQFSCLKNENEKTNQIIYNSTYITNKGDDGKNDDSLSRTIIIVLGVLLGCMIVLQLLTCIYIHHYNTQKFWDDNITKFLKFLKDLFQNQDENLCQEQKNSPKKNIVQDQKEVIIQIGKETDCKSGIHSSLIESKQIKIELNHQQNQQIIPK